MKYQLVIQFFDKLLDYDTLIEIEDALVDTLKKGNEADIDGHDIGTGEVNFFILTNQPENTFINIKHVVERKVSKEQYRAAYRAVEGDKYTNLWPSELVEFKIA